MRPVALNEGGVVYLQPSPVFGPLEVAQASRNPYLKSDVRKNSGQSSFMDALTPRKCEKPVQEKPSKSEKSLEPTDEVTVVVAQTAMNEPVQPQNDAPEEQAQTQDAAPVDGAPVPRKVLLDLLSLIGEDADQAESVSFDEIIALTDEGVAEEQVAELKTGFGEVLAKALERPPEEETPIEELLSSFKEAAKDVLGEEKAERVMQPVTVIVQTAVRAVAQPEAKTASEDDGLGGALTGQHAAALAAQTTGIAVQQPAQEVFALPADAPAAREVGTQLIERVINTVRDGQDQCEIQLRPEFLGRLSVTLSIAEGGAVTARIRTSDMAVQGMLQSQIETLKAQLEQQGVRVEEMEVVYQSVNYDFQQKDGAQDQPFEQQARRGPRLPVAGEDAGALKYDVFAADGTITQAAAQGATVEFRG